MERSSHSFFSGSFTFRLFMQFHFTEFHSLCIRISSISISWHPCDGSFTERPRHVDASSSPPLHHSSLLLYSLPLVFFSSILFCVLSLLFLLSFCLISLFFLTFFSSPHLSPAVHTLALTCTIPHFAPPGSLPHPFPPFFLTSPPLLLPSFPPFFLRVTSMKLVLLHNHSLSVIAFATIAPPAGEQLHGQLM